MVKTNGLPADSGLSGKYCMYTRLSFSCCTTLFSVMKRLSATFTGLISSIFFTFFSPRSNWPMNSKVHFSSGGRKN